MAVTGVVLVGFVIAHMLGNLKIFLGEEAIDSLRGLPPHDGRAAGSVRTAPVGGPHHPARQRGAAHRGGRPAHPA